MSHTATNSFQHDYLPAEAEPDGNLSLPLGGYEIKDSTEVESYLNHNNDLIDFLASLPAHISEMENDASVCLEHYHDIEENWEKLFVIVNTRIDNMDEADVLEDDLYSSLFEPKAELLSGRIVLSVE